MLLIGVPCALVLLIFLSRGHRGRNVEPASSVAPRTSVISPSQPAIRTNHVNERLYGALSAASTNLLFAQGRHQSLAELRQILSAAPSSEVSTAIRQFLDSKADATTGLGFKINGAHFLDQAPTLRVFLLDYLEQIDPAAAASYARVILSSKDSPDEWAIALRGLAVSDSSADGRALLEQKFAELLQYEPWQQNPSPGYLEAFDTAVYTGGTNFIRSLSDLVRAKDNQAVAFAAYLTLDRLTISAPAATLSFLESDVTLMDGHEQTRANYFARADVRDSAQKQLLETYLLNPNLSAVELDKFVGLYPNENFMVSHNLLTSVVTPSHAMLVERDTDALRATQAWLADPRFERIRGPLQMIRLRLDQLLGQANGSN
jgi:hypothetical protein